LAALVLGPAVAWERRARARRKRAFVWLCREARDAVVAEPVHLAKGELQARWGSGDLGFVWDLCYRVRSGLLLASVEVPVGVPLQLACGAPTAPPRTEAGPGELLEVPGVEGRLSVIAAQQTARLREVVRDLAASVPAPWTLEYAGARLSLDVSMQSDDPVRWRALAATLSTLPERFAEALRSGYRG
jgi:hypothetical protein